MHFALPGKEIQGTEEGVTVCFLLIYLILQ